MLLQKQGEYKLPFFLPHSTRNHGIWTLYMRNARLQKHRDFGVLGFSKDEYLGNFQPAGGPD
jgi:hypothetical protein